MKLFRVMNEYKDLDKLIVDDRSDIQDVEKNENCICYPVTITRNFWHVLRSLTVHSGKGFAISRYDYTGLNIYKDLSYGNVLKFIKPTSDIATELIENIEDINDIRCLSTYYSSSGYII